MVGIRKDPVISPGYRKPASDLRVGQGSAKGHQPPGDPGSKENGRCWRCCGHVDRGSKNAHSYDKAHHDHGEIEQVEFIPGRHGRKLGKILLDSAGNQSGHDWVVNPKNLYI